MTNLNTTVQTSSDTLYTIKQAAEYLKVHPQTIRNLIYSNQLPFIKMGRSNMLALKDLKAYNAKRFQKHYYNKK